MTIRRRAAVLLAATGLLASGCTSGPPAAEVENTPEPTPDAPPFATYYALGDSYTAAPFVPSTDSRDLCLRSSGNYPAIISIRLKGMRMVDLSCANASTQAITDPQRVGSTFLPAQLDEVPEDADLVTVGIGGSDFSFLSELLTGCVRVASLAEEDDDAPCREFSQELAETEGADPTPIEQLPRIGSRVRRTLLEVKEKVPDAVVLMVGYPQLVPAKGTCDELPIADGDYPFVRKAIRDLDSQLRRAARRAEVPYVGLMNDSKGHDICAGRKAWVNGSVTDTARALAYHPFAKEQEYVATKVLEAATRELQKRGG
ncbi:SGNH/GDSL hydrolase family protein [Nocardioides sp. SYSU D00038]|uniref:SGNH/GDSL hydrolase family protein n=1 Tax=Nocardioides sp. SYSU D00038 TaxID=2812554 RepID=UPI001966D49E|nr:SGNH/GDSL hydrolase family protein [Nocardioides sp. SYSU D00038]